MSITSLRFTRLSAALICATFCVPAKAQSTPESGSPWTLGIGAVWSPSPYRSYDNKAWPLPMVNYEGKSFYFRGATFGYRLFKTGSDEFSITASPLANRFIHDDTSDPRLRRLSDRDISGLVGVAWRHHADWGVIQASAQKEFTGHGGGSVFDANYSYPIFEGSLMLIPTVGVTYNTSGVNNYYYGISGNDALRSGLPFYHAAGGSSPYFGIVATYKLSRSWHAVGGIRYTALPDVIKDSPMADASHTQSYFLSLSYTL
ncbi:MAG: MipA/OmpV family protein [Rhodanobacter sp.]